MDNRTLNLVNQKIAAMDIADKELLARVQQLQSQLSDRVLALLLKMSSKNGKIDRSDAANKKILLKLNKELSTIITAGKLRSAVSPYLKVFDDVERISKLIIETENNLSLKDYNLSAEKELAIDEIATSLLNDGMLKANMATPIKKMLYRHVTTGIDYETARQEIIQFIKNDPDKLGIMEKYVRAVTQEALSRYDGMINQRVATDFGLDAFSIVGSLIKTSAEQCIHMINETGPFEGMAVNNKYAMSDLPAILAILRRYKGFVKGTNESNYFINRNHWGCRHVFIPTRFLRRDREQINKQMFGATVQGVGNLT